MYISLPFLLVLATTVGMYIYYLVKDSNELRRRLGAQEELLENFVEHVNQRVMNIDETKSDLIQSFAGMANFEFKFPEDGEQFDSAIERSKAILESHGLAKIKLRRFELSEVQAGKFT